MEVTNNLKPLSLSNEESAQRSINWVSHFLKKYSKVKVGMTDNPKSRASKYDSDEPNQWDEMYLLHGNKSRDKVHAREVLLIRHFGDRLENKGEYEGPESTASKHYVYVVLKK